MHDFAWALMGGLVMGVASAGLFILNGRILGISGVLGGALKVRSKEARWRWAFIGGMLAAGAACMIVAPSCFENTLDRSSGAYLAAGILVGVGTQLGSGCTSGHGICGIGRLSKRSIAATLLFMASGAAVVTMIRTAMGGAV